MDSGITFSELLDYTDRETTRWREWFGEHPEALDLPCDIAKAGTVRALLLHVFATELFFAHAVLELDVPDWQNLPSGTVAELFSVGEEARGKLRNFIAAAQPADWTATKDVGFGSLRATRRKMVAQALLHGIHHRAQLATFLRQQGFAGMWVHDLILTGVMD
jgi:uncharacterized damage-inducible protein DinB